MLIGKKVQHNEMLRSPILRRHLPETHWISRNTTWRMLRKYSYVFIKPNRGSGGSGIILAKRTRNGFVVRRGRKERRVVGFNSLYKAIKSYRKPFDRYVVQRGLRLAKYKGSIFDARIYMQKPRLKWVISGMTARVASGSRFVTNYHKGGHAEPLSKMLLILFGNNKRKVHASLHQIAKLSYMIAKAVNKRHSSRELGIDFGIDRNGRIWIIEANSKPGHMLFTQLKNKAMLRAIRRNKRLIWKRK